MTDSRIQIIPITGLPLLAQGQDLPKMILASLAKRSVRLRDGDVLVVGEKAVSKTEGRLVEARSVLASRLAMKIGRKTGRDPSFVQLILRDTRKLVRASRDAIIVTTKQGFTCLNAGVDKSNVQGDNTYALLPADPDKSARKIRSRILGLTGKKIAVIVSDTNSRPFRLGQIEHAIGVAGINPLVDYRGAKDLFGYQLKFKNVAVADELASAAELVMGQGTEQIPAALLRGVPRLKFGLTGHSSDLVVSRKEDLFRGTL